ncbi:RNA-binding S4 domain-containing protein [Nonlabens ponticola]|uniref:RNA-binding S4 domain-containing protein n=1 Tax=Nonlabens ponticola TaxID=2496866 RepID=A0A3S9N0E7_9FLAO|nr:RNA-binding S4 domain-containing protein [Nonlabens ponticola]AZQ44887.1 RNA-binding S4 domain-containing protein [Nonlabens ponticola]
MRIDKYLWSVRYFKTRSKATAAAKKGRLRVNGDVVKPARDVYPGDMIVMRKDQIDYTVEVLDLPPNRVGNKLVDLYRVDRTPRENFEARKMVELNQDYYRRKGEGRPTKKDRRELDDVLDAPHEEE